MSTSMNIHQANNITIVGGVSHNNSNAITLVVERSTDRVEISLFDLPTHVADGLNDLIGYGGISKKLDEAEIRADERRKILAKLKEDDCPF